MLWLNYVKYACLPQEGAESLLNKAMTQLESRGGRVTAAQKGMVTKDVHGSLTARAGNIIGEHPHTQAIPEE